MSMITTEFSAPAATPISGLYAGGAYVPAGTTGTNGPVPTAGVISFSDFYGTSAIPVGGAYHGEYGSDVPMPVSPEPPAILGAFTSNVTDTLTRGIYNGATYTLDAGLPPTTIAGTINVFLMYQAFEPVPIRTSWVYYSINGGGGVEIAQGSSYTDNGSVWSVVPATGPFSFLLQPGDTFQFLAQYDQDPGDPYSWITQAGSYTDFTET